jgi:hypothetical protein
MPASFSFLFPIYVGVSGKWLMFRDPCQKILPKTQKAAIEIRRGAYVLGLFVLRAIEM